MKSCTSKTKTTENSWDKIRKEMDDIMWKQGFASIPKFVEPNGDVITDSNQSVIDINKQYPGFKWVFYVTEPFLNKAEEISNKYSVDFYKNK